MKKIYIIYERAGRIEDVKGGIYLENKLLVRKQLLFTTIIATLVLCACAKEKTVSDDVSTEENRTVSDGVSIEENSDLAASQEETDVIDHTKSPKSREEVNIDAESAALYDKFLADEVKTTFYKKGDNSDLYFLSAFLKDGENYTLSEIIDGEISYRRDKYQENLKFDVFKDSYIDCGLDGDIEMVVEIYFEESLFPLYMIIKNVAGSLKVCFAGSNSGRKGTDIEYNGVVSEYLSFGRESNIENYAYIDAKGDYNSWYENENHRYFGGDEGDTLYDCFNVDSNIFRGVEELRVSFIRFDNEQEYAQFFLLDDYDGEEIDDVPINGVNPYDEARKILTEKGYPIISSEEATTLIDNRRREIGLTDEIYSYEG